MYVSQQVAKAQSIKATPNITIRCHTRIPCKTSPAIFSQAVEAVVAAMAVVDAAEAVVWRQWKQYKHQQ
eukprot:9413286-Ditylum_brightwellii.AAC.1